MPIISLDVYLAGGASAAPQALPGLGWHDRQPDLGAGRPPAAPKTLAGAIEQVGGALGSGGGSDSLSVGVFGLIEDAELAFDLLADMTLNASFPRL